MDPAENADIELVLPVESLESMLERHAAEKKDFRKRMMRIKSGIPKKDKAAKARAAESAEAEEKEILKRHAAEREALGLNKSLDPHNLTENVSNLSIKPSNDAGELQPSVQTGPGQGGKKESKAARRRRRKAEEEAEIQRRIEEEKSKMGPSAKYVESEAIAAQLKPKSLRIHAVAADGHCLYNAVAHQMRMSKLPSDVPPTVEGLRSATADYMLANMEEFMPFVESVDGKTDLFEGYCDNLRSEAVWGGQVEVKALAELLGSSIEVYAADMPVVVMGEKKENGDVLRVSFHRNYLSLGEHYNSVVPDDSNKTSS